MELDFPTEMVARVKARYDEPHRHYHTWSHVLACLDNRLRLTPAKLPAVDLALLFHDVIYDPLAGDNEEKSAELMILEAKRAGVAAEVIARAKPLVLATKHGAAVADSEEACIVVDADLSILGAEKETFDAYESAVREEYAMVPAAAFRAGRAKVLRGFLDRPFIFETKRGRKLWEKAARENMTRSLRALEA